MKLINKLKKVWKHGYTVDWACCKKCGWTWKPQEKGAFFPLKEDAQKAMIFIHGQDYDCRLPGNECSDDARELVITYSRALKEDFVICQEQASE